MTLADDLRDTATVQVAVVLQQMLSSGAANADRLARAAVDVAGPLLRDADRVEAALAAARESGRPPARRSRPAPSTLWRQAAGDEAGYLYLMQEAGWLELATLTLTAADAEDA